MESTSRSRANWGSAFCIAGVFSAITMISTVAFAHPTITLLNPADDDVFQAGDAILVEVEPQSGHEGVSIVSVSVVVDGQEIETKTEAPWSFELILDGGEHKIKATGLDSEDSPGESDLVYVMVEGMLGTAGEETGGGDDSDASETSEGSAGDSEEGTDSAKGGDDDDGESDDGGGCLLAPSGSNPTWAWAMSAIFGLSLVSRTRRRSAKRANIAA